MSDQKMKNSSLAELAADQLIDLILEQDLKPGDKLPNEYELATRLGIGRNTIREAIRRLASRNILIVRQGAGTFISQRTGVPEDPLGLTFIDHDPSLALELSDVRLLVEPAASELAAVHATQEQIDRMVELCEEIGLMTKSGRSYTPADLELHRYIGECCGNSILRNLILIIADAVSISVRVTEDRHRNVAYAEHFHIVQAIKRRDPVGARYAMMAHLNTGRQDFAQRIQKHQGVDAERDRTLPAKPAQFEKL